MSEQLSLRQRIERRLDEANCVNRTLVLHLIAGLGNFASLAVLQHVLDELHRIHGDVVVISNEDWKRLHGIGRKRLATAATALEHAGVVYTNHDIKSWQIDEALFWQAFEAALAQCMPVLPPDGSDPARGAHPPARDEQQALRAAHTPPVRDEQVGGGSEGSAGAEGVRDAHLILREREKGLIDLFTRFRLRFGDYTAALRRLLDSALRLGEQVTTEVLTRCFHSPGRSWGYVATALDRELNYRDHGRQITLMPGAEVPRRPAAKAAAPAPKKALPDSTPATPRAEWPPRDIAETTERDAAQASPEHEAWQTAYHQLELQLDGYKFESWLRDARFLRFEDGAFVIGVRNEAARNMLQHRLYRNVKAVVSQAWEQPAEIVFECEAPTAAADTVPFFEVNKEAS